MVYDHLFCKSRTKDLAYGKGLGAPLDMYSANIGQWSLECPSVLHLVHQTSSRTSLTFFMSCICRVRLASWLCIICIPVFDSVIGDASNFIAISKALFYEVIFCYINECLMWGSSIAMNHSWCCCGAMLKLTWPNRVLKFWSNSHIVSVDYCFISFGSVIH